MPKQNCYYKDEEESKAKLNETDSRANDAPNGVRFGRQSSRASENSGNDTNL